MIERYGKENAQILMEQSLRNRDLVGRLWGFATPENEVHSDEEQVHRWAKDLDQKGVNRVNFATGGGNDNLDRSIEREYEVAQCLRIGNSLESYYDMIRSKYRPKLYWSRQQEADFCADLDLHGLGWIYWHESSFLHM